MNDWLVVLTSVYPQDLYLAKSFLESEGIETFLQDELTAQVNNFYSNAIGGVKLLVPQGDFQRSVALLKEGGYLDSEEPPLPKIETVREFDRVHCPFCGSTQIQKRKDPNPAMMIFYLLFSVLLPLFKPTYQCWDCQRNWKVKRQ